MGLRFEEVQLKQHKTKFLIGWRKLRSRNNLGIWRISHEKYNKCFYLWLFDNNIKLSNEFDIKDKNNALSAKDLIAFYKLLNEQYHFLYLEDGLAEDDWIGWRKLTRELGWTPSLQFEEGLDKTVDWYLSNEKWLKNITSGDYQKYYEEQYSGR